jgi:F420-0:gamma-glutamyl ligase
MMAKKKETSETPDESVLVTAAKAIGTAAGKVAKLVGVEPEPREPAVSQKVPKLAKKEKHRLPRREKKALQKSHQ